MTEDQVRRDPDTPVEELWERFHELVNMTSKELADWLGQRKELVADPADTAPPLGKAVLGILRKRCTDLTTDDLDIMWRVIAIVEDETEGQSVGALASEERRRYRLMNLGHDPIRAG